MNKPSGLSEELERSMNMQVRVMTFEEALRNAAVIDALDDKRRTRLYNTLSWNKDRLKGFISSLEKINDKEIYSIVSKMKEFYSQLISALDELKKEDFHYEEIDDNTRNFLISYAVRCREELQHENSKVETKLILENIERRIKRK